MTALQLRQWAEDDLELLRRKNTPEMTRYLGGPEPEEKLVSRHHRYVAMTDASVGRMFSIRLPEPAGSVGYWEKEWRGSMVYETGWQVLPEYQGRWIAVAATRELIALLRPVARHRYLHAFPKIENAPSNAICRKLGFTLLGEDDFEYPPGNPIRCNDWRYDLRAHS
ncbi:MAG: GNAT family N-acetyltransferase [Micromonosporaceae bacterium]